MRLAQIAGIETPLHGLIYTKDNSFSYFIKRFDRYGKNNKRGVEDFAQLSGKTRDTKYNSSMEKVVEILDNFCAFPALEKAKLFRLILFNFLVGNEDMHLKNFSLLTDGPVVALSPAYDLVNTSIALHNPKEEIALPIKGKKRSLSKNLLFHYFAEDKLGLTEKSIDTITDDMHKSLPTWRENIQNSFLSSTMKEKYLSLIQERAAIMGISSGMASLSSV
jgi:serine/threonine-protein kinase HipA